MFIAFSLEANSGMAGGVSARRDVTRKSASLISCQPGCRNSRNLMENGSRNLLQICCLLDDFAAIINWGAMAKQRADNVELGGRGWRRFVQ
jgi:hypothetical protein